VFPELLECLPNARYIFVVRNPRSIVASMLEVGRKYRKDLKMPLAFTRTTRSAVECINSLWENGNAALLKSNNVLVVYYEDIVSNPRKAIGAMTDFLELPFEDGLLNIQDSNWEMPEFKSDEKYWYTKDQLKGEIRKDATEKWSRILSGYDLYLIDKRMKRIPGLTDRYPLKVDGSLQWALKDFFGNNLARIRWIWARGFTKLSRLL
jgi:hypothetical protein